MTPEDWMKKRAVIQFCVNLGKTPKETLEMIYTASTHLRHSDILYTNASAAQYNGRESFSDDSRTGRPVTKIGPLSLSP